MKITSTFILSLMLLQINVRSLNLELEPANDSNYTANKDTMRIKLTVGSAIFTATLQNNAAVTAFKTKLPLTMNMTELNGNEKYYDLAHSIPANASNPGTIQAGDLMLYGKNTLVLFYKSFSTTYHYTRLGRIDNPSGLDRALGSGNVTVKIELE